MLGPPIPIRSDVEREFVDLERAELSPRFAEFLPYFALEAVRCGGEARVVREDGSVAGLWLTDPSERIASIFARSATVAERLFRERGSFATYCEHRFEPRAEPFVVYERSFSAPPPPHSFRHQLRPVGPDDLPGVIDLAREVDGSVNERWFRRLSDLPEFGILAEVGGRLAGVGWVSLVDGRARLHSLSVRPRFRRLGVASDLVAARVLWAFRSGAAHVISEISERSVGSTILAERAGMRPAGAIYLYPPASPPG
ncbi:MAG: GNAT family N-acetyltransferase [Thermoplasmata archaeon]|nr:GNAT family N-acetyltransferase [Thermoplasmata archaeon]